MSALRKLISMIQEMLDTEIGRVCMEERQKLHGVRRALRDYVSGTEEGSGMQHHRRGSTHHKEGSWH